MQPTIPLLFDFMFSLPFSINKTEFTHWQSSLTGLADLEVSMDTLELSVLEAGFRKEKKWNEKKKKRPLEMFAEILPAKTGWVSGLGMTSSSEWRLMKTNDLTGSKGWDQGWRIPRPSQFPTLEINEGREQPFLCIIYPLRPLNLMAAVCSPPVGPLKPYNTEPGGIASWMRVVTTLSCSQLRQESIV